MPPETLEGPSRNSLKRFCEVLIVRLEVPQGREIENTTSQMAEAKKKKKKVKKPTSLKRTNYIILLNFLKIFCLSQLEGKFYEGRGFHEHVCIHVWVCASMYV